MKNVKVFIGGVIFFFFLLRFDGLYIDLLLLDLESMIVDFFMSFKIMYFSFYLMALFLQLIQYYSYLIYEEPLGMYYP